MQALSTIISLYSMSGYCCATARIDFRKSPSDKFHDVGFVNGVNLLAAMFFGVIKRKPRDPRRSFFGDDFQALHHAGNNFMLESRIQILGIFAHQNDVHVFEIAILRQADFSPGAGWRTRSSVLRNATLTLGAPPAMAVAIGPFQRHVIAPHRLDRGLADQLAFFRALVGAPFQFFPIDLHARGFQDAPHCGGDFRADAFAGDQRDFVSHRCIIL